jgi:hypothetical protein
MADKKESAGAKMLAAQAAKDLGEQRRANAKAEAAAAKKAAADDAAAKQAEKDAKAQDRRARVKKREDAKQHRELVMKVSGLNITQLAQQKKDEGALAERKAQLDALKKTMADMGLSIEGNKKIAKEEGKIAKAEIKLQTQNKSTLSKLVGFLTPGGPGDKEKLNEANRKHKGLMGMFGDMKKGIVGMGGKLGGLAKGLGGMAAGGAKGLLGMLKKGALFLAIPALIAFMQSPMFEDLKKWIVDEMIPALGRMVDAIKPVAIAIVNWVKDSFLPITISMLVQGFKDLSTFFSDVFARFSGWSDMTLREKIGAVLGIFTNITELVGKLVGNMIEAVANLFGADGATIRKKYWDPIAKFFTDIVDSVMLIFTDPVAGIKKLFSTLWGAAKGIGGWIFDHTIKPVWDWFSGLFSFSAKDETDAAGTITTGETKGIWDKVLHAIIPEGVFTFIKDPMGWVWVNILGISTGVDGKMPSAAEAAEQIASGKADGIFAKVMGAFLPQGLIEFILDPIDWIFTKVLKLGGEGEKKKSTGQKADIILGTAVGLFEKVLKAILPDGLVDLIMSPINWLFRKVLGIEPNQILDSVSEAHGVEKGDATGLWQSMMDAILPAGLAKFIGDPIGYIFTDILGLGGEGEEMPSTKEKSKVVAGVAVGLFKSVLKAILPDGLVDFMFKPLDWLFGKMGINVGESMKSAEEAAGVEVGDAKGIFAKVLGAILPAGLVDFIMSPISWILDKIGIGEDKSADDFAEGFKMPTIADIKAFLPKWLTDPIGWVKGFFGGSDEAVDPAVKQAQIDAVTKQIAELEAKKAAATSKRMKANIGADITKAKRRLEKIEEMASGGHLSAGTLSLVGEKGPELFMSSKPGTVIPNKGLDFMKNAALMGATKPSAATNQAPILVNNITNAPVTNSSQSNTKINTAIGSSDPFTHVAVAY